MQGRGVSREGCKAFRATGGAGGRGAIWAEGVTNTLEKGAYCVPYCVQYVSTFQRTLVRSNT
jgi:hypothetical protein